MIASENVGADRSPVTVDDIWVALARVGREVDRAKALADRLNVAPGDVAALGAKAICFGVHGGMRQSLARAQAVFRAATPASSTPDGAA
jgi:hypothetical protein